MPGENDGNGARRRLMHTRSVECNGYLRDDDLWEVEARLVDTKPFAQRGGKYCATRRRPGSCSAACLCGGRRLFGHVCRGATGHVRPPPP
jgi:hypothetical protein